MQCFVSPILGLSSIFKLRVRSYLLTWSSYTVLHYIISLHFDERSRGSLTRSSLWTFFFSSHKSVHMARAHWSVNWINSMLLWTQSRTIRTSDGTQRFVTAEDRGAPWLTFYSDHARSHFRRHSLIDRVSNITHHSSRNRSKNQTFEISISRTRSP